jgi:hypothetical protein
MSVTSGGEHAQLPMLPEGMSLLPLEPLEIIVPSPIGQSPDPPTLGEIREMLDTV